MHDGRFTTLAQVVDHYSTGIQDHPNLDPRLRGPNGNPLRLNLSAAQKLALVAFMNTLTDSSFNSDARYSDPIAANGCDGAATSECIYGNGFEE